MLADADVEAEIGRLEEALDRRAGTVVLVSNEVGFGIVPDNALARRFRDLQGRLNQRLAARADRVVLLVAGLPLDREGKRMTRTIDDAEAERHRAKMAKRKAVQDAEVAEKTIEKGLLIVHTGTGKGKSTAAFGLALRMLGRGHRVGVVQFIKGAWHTAERDALAAFGDQVAWHTMGEGFTWETQDLKRDIAAAERAWAKSLELMADPAFGLVILDELNIALRYEYLDLQAVVAALRARRRRAARRRHRPQRQARPDRRRRSRHRDDPGEASFRRRREGAARHRVLTVAARALMFQGTGSDVGKSLIVAGLARAFADRGLAVRPFKPQNMSNNAAVTADGGEIGRAQALQARAARTPPSVHMNPVLLKPQSEIGAQIVVQGRVHGTAKAAAYQSMKPELLPFVLDSFARLQSEADLVLVEGAGSASEVNLRANDIANMGFARAADVPVVLIGDIDRGGVIASLVGTRTVIDADDAALIRGFLVNKFRGDPALFADGMATIARATGWQALGLVPFFPDARLLPAEDALALDRPRPAKPQARVRIAVPILPHIANFDDLDPLDAEPTVDLVPRAAGGGASGQRRSRHPARARRRPSRISPRCARRAFTSTSPRTCAAAAPCSGFAAGTRCWDAPSTIRPASKEPAGTAEGLGLLDDRDRALRRKAARSRCSGETSERRPVLGLRDAHGRDQRPRLRAAVRAARRRIAGGRGLGRWACDRHLYPRAVRRRPAALRLARAARRRSVRGRL